MIAVALMIVLERSVQVTFPIDDHCRDDLQGRRQDACRTGLEPAFHNRGFTTGGVRKGAGAPAPVVPGQAWDDDGRRLRRF